MCMELPPVLLSYILTTNYDKRIYLGQAALGLVASSSPGQPSTGSASANLLLDVGRGVRDPSEAETDCH